MKSTLPSSKSLQKEFNKLCDPSKLYLILSFIGVIMYLIHFVEHTNAMYTLTGLLAQVIMMLLWTYILNWVCKIKKYGVALSWFLLFLPFILVIVFVAVFMYSLSNLVKKQQPKEEECETCGQGILGYDA